MHRNLAKSSITRILRRPLGLYEAKLFLNSGNLEVTKLSNNSNKNNTNNNYNENNKNTTIQG